MMKQRKKVKKHMEKWLQCLIAFAMVLALSLVVEVGANWDRLQQGQTDREVVPETAILTQAMRHTEQGYHLDLLQGVVQLKLDGAYVGDFHYNFDFGGLVKAEVVVTYQNRLGHIETETIADNSPYCIGQSSVPINRHVISLDLKISKTWLTDVGMPEEELSLYPLVVSNFSVDNHPQVNPYRFALVALIGSVFSLLWIFRDFFGAHLEYGFVMIALSVGILLISTLPVGKVGWDEEIHLFDTYQLSLEPNEVQDLPEQLYTLFNITRENDPNNIPQSLQEKRLQALYYNDVYEEKEYEQTTVKLGGGLAGLATPGYAPQAIGLKLGRLLGLSFEGICFMGRLFGLLFYCAVMCLSIRLLPVGKRILTVIALMPSAIFTACIFSYDMMVLSMTTLGLAMILSQHRRGEGEISWKICVGAMAVMLYGMLPKAVYAPLILTGLLLPASGFADKKQKYLIRAGFIVTFLLLMSSFVLPTLIAPSDTGDIRGGAVSTSGQLSLILHQPLSYAGILMKNIFTRLPECFAGMEVFRLLGHLMVSKFPYFTYVYAVLVLLTDRPEPTVEPLRAKQHIGLFVCVAAAVALIFTALYLSFTEPGSSVIQGVQGRYFLPLLFPLYLALNSQMVQIRLRRAAFNRVILCISAFLLFAMAATNISLHCM